MSMGDFTLRQLLSAGVHFGHQTHRWNPLMDPYIHSARSGIHIIDLTQSVPMLRKALQVIENVVAGGGTLLLVGTKRQASGPIASAAIRCNQFHVNHRWLGGTLTNWNTVSNSIERLNSIDERIEKGVEGLTKKERLGLLRAQAKLQASLGGIRNMESVPDMLFVIDVKKEALAIAEANKLGIPVVAVVDTNCSPQGITHIIPGNDDSIRAINLYCDLVTEAALKGTRTMLHKAGMDIDEKFEDLDFYTEESAPDASGETSASQDGQEPVAEPVSEEASAASAEENKAEELNKSVEQSESADQNGSQAEAEAPDAGDETDAPETVNEAQQVDVAEVAEADNPDEESKESEQQPAGT